MNKYLIVVWHGEGLISLFYVIKESHSEGDDPNVIATFYRREDAVNFIDRLTPKEDS